MVLVTYDMNMQSFEKIIEANNGILYKIGKVYSDEDGFDDLYQEMLINIWRGLKNYKGDAQISTWLYRVCLNTAMTYQKKEKRKQVFQNRMDESHDLRDESPDWKEKEAEVERLYAAVRTLKVEDRSIILLYLEEKSYDEISDMIGITKSNVGVKINRIKKSLFKKLEAYGRR